VKKLMKAKKSKRKGWKRNGSKKLKKKKKTGASAASSGAPCLELPRPPTADAASSGAPCLQLPRPPSADAASSGELAVKKTEKVRSLKPMKKKRKIKNGASSVAAPSGGSAATLPPPGQGPGPNGLKQTAVDAVFTSEEQLAPPPGEGPGENGVKPPTATDAASTPQEQLAATQKVFETVANANGFSLMEMLKRAGLTTAGCSSTSLISAHLVPINKYNGTNTFQTFVHAHANFADEVVRGGEPPSKEMNQKYNTQ
jgi:hypothetical protein